MKNQINHTDEIEGALWLAKQATVLDGKTAMVILFTLLVLIAGYACGYERGVGDAARMVSAELGR